MIEMKLFAAIEEVFENPEEIYKTLFFPLLTIDLSQMDKGEGCVHFLSVWGNGGANDYMIEDDISVGFDFVRFGWTGKKYLFDNSLFNPEYRETLLKWYNEIEKEYVENKIDYLTPKSSIEAQKSFLTQQNKMREKISLDYQLYATSLINYWVTRDKYFETGKFIQGSAYTDDMNDEERKIFISLSKTKKTTRNNELIGKVCGYNYKDYGEDEISLYIDRKESKVFQKFGWS